MLRVWPWLPPCSRRGCDGDVLFSPPFLENLEKLGNDSWKGGQAGGRACRDSESPPFAGVQEHEGVWVLSSTIRIWELGAWARPQEKGRCGKVSNNRIERSLCVHGSWGISCMVGGAGMGRTPCGTKKGCSYSLHQCAWSFALKLACAHFLLEDHHEYLGTRLSQAAVLSGALLLAASSLCAGVMLGSLHAPRGRLVPKARM